MSPGASGLDAEGPSCSELRTAQGQEPAELAGGRAAGGAAAPASPARGLAHRCYQHLRVSRQLGYAAARPGGDGLVAPIRPRGPSIFPLFRRPDFPRRPAARASIFGPPRRFPARSRIFGPSRGAD